MGVVSPPLLNDTDLAFVAPGSRSRMLADASLDLCELLYYEPLLGPETNSYGWTFSVFCQPWRVPIRDVVCVFRRSLRAQVVAAVSDVTSLPTDVSGLCLEYSGHAQFDAL